MTGILIVSHSAKIAEGAREMALEMAGDGVEVLAVGGSSDGRLGTDFAAIAAALAKLTEGGKEAVVVMDLGSAVMTVRAAVDELADAAGRVFLADAPVVEGAVFAAVEASMGAGGLEVMKVAQGAKAMEKLA